MSDALHPPRDRHAYVAATTVAADQLMLTFEGDPIATDYLLNEWREGLPHMAHTSNPTIPVFVVSAAAAHPQESQAAGLGQGSA